MANLVAHHTTLWQNGISCRDVLSPNNSMQSQLAYTKYTKIRSSSHCVPLLWLLLLICSFASASAVARTNGGAPGGWKRHKQNLECCARSKKLLALYMLFISVLENTLQMTQNPAMFRKNPFGCNSFETAASQNHHCLRKADPVLPVAKLIRKCQPCLPRNCNHMQPRPPKTLSRNHRDTEEKACAIEMNVRPMAHLLHRHTLGVEGHTTSQQHYVIDCDWVKQWRKNDTSNI